MTTTTPRRGVRAGLAVLALTAGMAAFAPAALAQTDSQGDGAQSEQGGGRPGRPQLTDEQQACLEEAGVEKPAEGQRPTDAQREAFRAAAEQCGIDLPERPPAGDDGAGGQDGDSQDGAQNQSTSV
jgi:hypothetical protein